MPSYVLTLLVTGSPDEIENASDRHWRHLRSLHADGKLRMAGAFKNGDGFLEILDVRDRFEAESISRSSPLVEAGLVAWMLREWEEIDFLQDV